MLVGAPALAETEEDLPPDQAWTSTQTEAQPPPWKPFNLFSLLSEDGVRAELERRHLDAETFPELLEQVTRGLVAAPYLLSPLGEGERPDPDPKFRMDAFDCTTFVETAMAMAVCDDLDQVEGVLDEIRYHGPPSFQNRRHLMTSQWIPGLIEGGWVTDVTEEVGRKKTKWIQLRLTKRRWQNRRIARSLHLEEVPRGTFPLPYVTIEDLQKLKKRIPPGTIVNVIRKDVVGSPEVVTHQGLIIHKPGMKKIKYVRHASPVSKRVIDETLEHMLKRYLKPGRKWPIIGMNFLRVEPPQ